MILVQKFAQSNMTFPSPKYYVIQAIPATHSQADCTDITLNVMVAYHNLTHIGQKHSSDTISLSH